MYFINNNHLFGAEATQLEADRLSKIEAQNQRHENEISLLKIGKIEDRKEIQVWLGSLVNWKIVFNFCELNCSQ